MQTRGSHQQQPVEDKQVSDPPAEPVPFHPRFEQMVNLEPPQRHQGQGVSHPEVAPLIHPVVEAWHQ